MRSEFTVADQHHYDQRSPLRWIASHLLRFKAVLFTVIFGLLGAQILNAVVPGLVGRAFDAVLNHDNATHRLTVIAIILFVVVIVRGAADLFASRMAERLAKGLERDARDELFLSLLGKSQTFHNRQRVGDLMARAANDVRQLSQMVVPGMSLILDSFTGLCIPIIFIAFLDWRLLAAPLVFTVAFGFALRLYMRQLNPVSGAMRTQFGNLNAELTETVTGIEVVKSTGQETQEFGKFNRNAKTYRDLFTRQGLVQARYIPTLLVGVAQAGALLHGVWFVSKDQLTVGQLVAYLGLMQMLRFPTFISIFTFSLVQLGIVSAERILRLMREETELDENTEGYNGEMHGEIVFDHVTFSYEGEPVLNDISFTIEPGQTVAIVGETGSGKSTLTKLVNRLYDVDSGRILIDGIDVRDWSLDALRSRISTIEQDIVLFSRPVAENIAFSLGQIAEQSAIERAARDAQAHDFISALPEKYETIIGERGVTLSGGQRQRLAIARALLTDPRILILDDSTSAIDSATEDEIQRAIRRVLEGRTTLLITHRLSQIRWSDKVIVLKHGEVVDEGTHEELLARCDLYQRIFARYDMAPAIREPEVVAQS
ncbi:MAG: ABC transporter ATP-binding protein [Thermomicrobiales bacterium]